MTDEAPETLGRWRLKSDQPRVMDPREGAGGLDSEVLWAWDLEHDDGRVAICRVELTQTAAIADDENTELAAESREAIEMG